MGHRGFAMNINDVVQHGVRVMPPRSAWIESWGFVLLGFGVYLGLSCLSFHPSDYGQLGSGTLRSALASGTTAAMVENLGGPVGAWLSGAVLGRFGIMGLVWPLVLTIWGAMTALGFVILPNARRFSGFLAMVISLSAFAQVQFPRWGIAEPVFGYGGLIGDVIAKPLLVNMGHGGALITVLVMAIVSMILTGNITVSRTATVAGDGLYAARKAARKAWQRHVVLRVTGHAPVAAGNPARAVAPGSEARATASTAVAGASSSTQASTARSAAKADSSVEEKSARDSKAARDTGGATERGTAEVEYGLDLNYDGPPHEKPTAKLFTRSEKAPPRDGDFKKLGDMLTAQLAEFKVEGKVTNVIEGPVVTTYEFEPAPGTKVAKIAGLGEDLARLLSAKSLRVLAPIPGKNTVGFEVPNPERRVIGFADLIEDEKYRAQKMALPIAMGVDIFGAPVIEDLAEMPHLLVAGSTGSGKSVFMNTLIASLIARHTAKDLRMIMVDPKMVEMAAYNPLPHMACQVVTDAAVEAKSKLDGLVVEMEDRYQRMRAVGAKNVKSFNEIVRTRRKGEFRDFEGRWAPMPYVVLIIDELADMMMVLGREAEVPITRLAQKARAAGMHLVIATQRPSADVVTGLIKANFPTRVAFRVLSGVDSRTILDTSGAETLLGKGDMLYLSATGLRRLHGAFLNDNEVASMVRAAKARKT